VVVIGRKVSCTATGSTGKCIRRSPFADKANELRISSIFEWLRLILPKEDQVILKSLLVDSESISRLVSHYIRELADRLKDDLSRTKSETSLIKSGTSVTRNILLRWLGPPADWWPVEAPSHTKEYIEWTDLYGAVRPPIGKPIAMHK
jgi:hypothetical protein